MSRASKRSVIPSPHLRCGFAGQDPRGDDQGVGGLNSISPWVIPMSGALRTINSSLADFRVTIRRGAWRKVKRDRTPGEAVHRNLVEDGWLELAQTAPLSTEKARSRIFPAKRGKDRNFMTVLTPVPKWPSRFGTETPTTVSPSISLSCTVHRKKEYRVLTG